MQFPGWATIPDPKKPGELVVHLVGVPVAAPYWVFKLGPETYGAEGQYEYAVVSSELQVSLFVLTRNVTTFYSTWKPEVDTYLAQNGWDKVRGVVFGSFRRVPSSCWPYLRAALELAHQHHSDWVHVLVKRDRVST